MKIIDITNRVTYPIPWSEGEKIPWNDPDFSQRMLQEHLSQEHDAASRRLRTIDQHVEWIHQQVLMGKSGRILDLGCGPGLYTSRFARLGHACVGIDFSPASITYAREYAAKGSLRCTYIQEDIRAAAFGEDYDLVMMIFGEFNVFRPRDAREILQKAFSSLEPGGYLLLEAFKFQAVQQMVAQATCWYSAHSGLFSDRPHICLIENFWHSEENVATERFYIIDAQSGRVSQQAASTQAYSDEEYQIMIRESGFQNIQFFASLGEQNDEGQSDFSAILAQKIA